jgi:casein kinase 1
VHLIDFGISKYYKDQDGKHLPENNRVLFAGNILFSSVTAFRNKCKYLASLTNLEPSRRDDIISLLYMLVYLINGKNHWLGDLNPSDLGYFRKVGQIKKQLNAETLCVHDALCLKEFAAEVFRIQFSEQPNYAKLKH